MPRYFFSIHDHVREEDETGTELRDNSQARLQAIIFAAEILQDNPDLVWDGHELKVRVKDEQERVVASVFVRAESH